MEFKPSKAIPKEYGKNVSPLTVSLSDVDSIPIKLHELLDRVEAEGFANVIRDCPDGGRL
jgi:hypothetical protein